MNVGDGGTFKANSGPYFFPAGIKGRLRNAGRANMGSFDISVKYSKSLMGQRADGMHAKPLFLHVRVVGCSGGLLLGASMASGGRDHPGADVFMLRARRWKCRAMILSSVLL